MDPELEKDRNTCPSSEISAYLDGELSPRDEMALEMHLGECEECRRELNVQKSILLALDSTLEETERFELPDNFTRSVVVNAESSVSGLRRPNERLNAALILGGLLLISIFALGADGHTALAAGVRISEQAMAVAISVCHFVFDIARGFAVVLRSLSAGLVSGSGVLPLAFAAVLFAALIAFTRYCLRLYRA